MDQSTSCLHTKGRFMIASEFYYQRLAISIGSSSLFYLILLQTALNLNLCFGEEVRRMCSGVDESANQLEEASLKKLFSHHLLQLRCNSHSVSELAECSQSGKYLGGDSGEGPIKSMQHVSFGTVLLPTASLMNHSCLPNAIFRLVH